jgi:hypothetical protein
MKKRFAVAFGYATEAVARGVEEKRQKLSKR